ncbi:MAG: hypothetical protein ACE5PV_21195 [Candidatus Poribacteria bacterium]
MKPLVEFRSPPSEELRKEIYEVYNQVFAIVKESIGIDLRERIQARFIVDTVPHVQACVNKFTEIHGGKCPHDEFLGETRIWNFPLLCVEGHGLMEIEFLVRRESEDDISEINYVLTSAGVLTWLLPHEFTEHYLIEELSLNPNASHARWLREGLGNYASVQVTKKLQLSLYLLMTDHFRELLSQRTEANLIKDWTTEPIQEEFFYAASTLLLLHA